MSTTYDPTTPTARDRLRHDLFDFDVSYDSTGGIGPVTINTIGTGYITPPSVVFTGGTPTTPAAGHVLLTGTGGVAVVVMDNPGAGYATLPTVSFIGGGGSGATAVTEFLTNALEIDATYDQYIILYGEDEAKWRLAAAFLARYGLKVDGVTTSDGTHILWRNRIHAWEAIVTTWAQYSSALIRGRQKPLVGAIAVTGIIGPPETTPFDANDQRYRGSAYPRWRWPDG